MLGERLYVLCALETNIALQGVSTAQPHLEQYRQWLGTQCARLAEPGYILVEDSVDLVNMASKDRRRLIPKVLEQCKAIGCGDIGIAIWKAYDQLVNIFEGKTDFLDLVINDGTLSNVYNWANDMWDVSEFFQLLGHMQPQMKVLEIGAGTGGLTAKVLEHLRSSYGERLYLQYTFTDVSSGFFPAANKRFAEYQAIEYKVLDISRHPLEQGFQHEEYDLIIASNVRTAPPHSFGIIPLNALQVLHATPILHDTLVHVRTLLKPQGRLFLQELSPGKF
jgi:SAM-dependent methyltransferase